MKDANTNVDITPKVAVRLSGTGGQGLLLAGRILAEAAAIFDGLNVVQSNSYGPEARGGASRSEVVISRGEVDDLRCKTFDILVCLSQKACDSYYGDLEERGILIVDSTSVNVVPTSRAIEVPMTKMAVEECGDRMTANIIALGVLCGFSEVVTLKALDSALAVSMRKDLLEKNRKALQLGYAAGKEAQTTLPEKKRSGMRDYSFVREEVAIGKDHRKNGRSKVAAAA
jgi:2-oxoglutarate ferredoxin oxidoreductase subunit gamma